MILKKLTSSMMLFFLSFVLVNCSKDDETVPPLTTMQVSIENATSESYNLLLDKKGTLTNKWSINGYSFWLYLEQNGNILYAASKHTKESKIDDVYANLNVDVPILASINNDNSYRIIGVDGGVDVANEDGGILCKPNLERGHIRIYAWYVANIVNGSASTARARFLTSGETLWIHNKTDKPIKVKHKGYDVKDKWYYTKANVKITASPNIKTEAVGVSTDSEVFSDVIEIDAGESGYVLSRFVPTGVKIKDNCLIMEIDGKEVKTNPISSEMTLENGKAYYWNVIWDGNRLRWETEPEHEYVDLGLPSGTLWATCNVGANSPEEYGDYFAWGETEPKESYSWKTYKWDSDYGPTKYSDNDGKTELDLEDDAAYVNWGSNWRMPSKDQLRELSIYCNWEWIQQNNANGCKYTGPNGNTLFLPAAGNYSGSSILENANILGLYWSRTLNVSWPSYSYRLSINYMGDGINDTDRWKGYSVRPVFINTKK